MPALRRGRRLDAANNTGMFVAPTPNDPEPNSMESPGIDALTGGRAL